MAPEVPRHKALNGAKDMHDSKGAKDPHDSRAHFRYRMPKERDRCRYQEATSLSDKGCSWHVVVHAQVYKKRMSVQSSVFLQAGSSSNTPKVVTNAQRQKALTIQYEPLLGD